MKNIAIMIAALAILSTSALAAPSNCWRRTGNWVGGENYTACMRVDDHNQIKNVKCEKKI